MHLRHANACVLSLQVPITGKHLLLGIEKSRPLIRACQIDGLPDASKAKLQVKVPTNLEATAQSTDSNVICSQKSFSVSDRREKKNHGVCLYSFEH